MNFTVTENYAESYETVYHPEEQSFDLNTHVNVDINVLIAYINLGIDSDIMEIRCIWGFSPRKSWQECKLTIPSAECGGVCLNGNYSSGITMRMDNRACMWKSYFDISTQWYCLGEPKFLHDETAVRINRNTIIVLNKSNELKSVYIHLS